MCLEVAGAAEDSGGMAAAAHDLKLSGKSSHRPVS